MAKIIISVAGIYLNLLAYILPGVAARQGFRLWCRPFRSPLSKYHKKFLNSAERFSFEHDGVVIQGYRWGNGEKKILFIHGWQSHTFRWKAYVDAISKNDFTIYAIDAPGHGLSGGSYLTVPFYSAVILQLMGTLGKVHTIVGHSLGCFAILHALHEHPALPVGNLILMAPPGEASDFMLFYKQTLKLSDKTMTLILACFEKVIQRPISYFSTTAFASNLNIPGIIIHDEKDAETPYDYAVQINRQWKQSKLITTQGLGHNLKSLDVVQEITKFITRKPKDNVIMEIMQDTITPGANQ